MSKFADILQANLVIPLSAAGTSPVTGTATNFVGCDKAVYLLSGSCAASATVTWTVEESATAAGSYTACAATSGSVAPTVMTASNDNEAYIMEVTVNKAKPWQELIATPGGSGNVQVFAYGLAGDGGTRQLPPTQENTLAIW
jgi:hypothetical protein